MFVCGFCSSKSNIVSCFRSGGICRRGLVNGKQWSLFGIDMSCKVEEGREAQQGGGGKGRFYVSKRSSIPYTYLLIL